MGDVREYRNAYMEDGQGDMEPDQYRDDEDEQINHEVSVDQIAASYHHQQAPPPVRVSRSDMLDLNQEFHQKFTTGKDNKRKGIPEAAKLLLYSNERQKTRASLLDAALKIVNKRKEEAALAAKTNQGSSSSNRGHTSSVSPYANVPIHITRLNRTTPVKKTTPVKVTTPVEKPGPESGSRRETLVKPSSPKRKIRRVSSFSKILNESPVCIDSEDSQELPPCASLTHKPERLFTRQEVDELLKKSREVTQPTQFSTSTPIKKTSPMCNKGPVVVRAVEVPSCSNKEPQVKSSVVTTRNTSGTDRTERLLSTSNKKLFAEGTNQSHDSSSLESIPPASPLAKSLDRSIQEDIIRADMNTLLRKFLQENAEIIRDEHRKLSIDIVHCQKGVAQSTAALSQNFKLSMQDVIHKTADIIRKQTLSNLDTMKANMDSYLECQKQDMEAHEENRQAVSDLDEKLGERLLLRQIKLVEGLEKISKAVVHSSNQITSSQEKMITGAVNMTDTMTKLSYSMSRMIDSTEALHLTHLSMVSAVAKADDVIGKVVGNLQSLSIAQERLNNAFSRQPLAASLDTTHGTEKSEKPIPEATPAKYSPAQQPTIPIDGEVLKRASQVYTETSDADGDHSYITTSAYLTHPDPPQGKDAPVYNASPSLPSHPATYVIPATAILATEIDHNEGAGLPSFSVLHKDDFVIVQDTVTSQTAPEYDEQDKTSQAPSTEKLPMLQGEIISDTETEGSVSDRGEGADHMNNVPKRSTRNRVPKKYMDY